MLSNVKQTMVERIQPTYYYLTFVLIVILTLAASGCKDENAGIGPDGSPSNIIFPTSNVSYSQYVQPLFNQACARSGCHSAAENPDALKLDSYENLMYGHRGTRDVVAPGSPSTSRLVSTIDGSLTPRMPPAGNPLNQNQINGIRAWIAEGALRN